MTDTRDLLREAVGFYEPRVDELGVLRRVERRRRARRVTSGAVALGLVAAMGVLGWTVFGPMDGAPGSGEGTYVLSGFSVEAYVDPATGDVDPRTAVVTFTARWSSPEYPGTHRCEVRVASAEGVPIGARILEVSDLSRSTLLTASVALSRPADGAMATGSCEAGRLDLAVPATTVAEQIGFADGSLAVVYRVELVEGERIGAQACTSAVWDSDGGLLGTTRFTLRPTEGTHAAGLGVDEGTARTQGSAATVLCEPYVRPGAFPDPEPPVSTTTVVVPAVVGMPGEQAVQLLEALGLVVVVADGTSEGVVLDQDPGSSVAVEEGSTVTITVGDRPPASP